jgi:general L-amino acid transport system permease protein
VNRRGVRPPAAGFDLRSLLAQVLVVAALAGAASWLIANTLHNLEQRHVSTGFSFLSQVSSLPIADSPIAYDPASSTFGQALWIGFLNTLILSGASIVAATVVGTIVGLARLSPNWMAATLAGVYVGVVRNVPALLVVLFTMSQMRRIGPPRQAIDLPGGAFLSNRGLVLPSFTEGHGLGWVLAAALAGGVLVFRFTRGRTHRVAPAFAAAVLAAVLAFALVPLRWQLSLPQLKGFNFVGGTVVSLEFCAMLVALTVVFAAYVAETVRAGVQSVPRGQWDAAEALGLSRGTILRLVVLPLALRAIVPPLTNSYLGVVKASALGVAIGYQELVSVVNTALSMTGQSVELVLVLMLAYLAIGLAIGGVSHWYNERLVRRGSL